jgi:hypothetical protein
VPDHRSTALHGASSGALLKPAELGEVPALSRRFRCVTVVVPAHVCPSFPSSYAVEDGKTGERGPGPAATTPAGHFHPLMAGPPPRLSQHAADQRDRHGTHSGSRPSRYNPKSGGGPSGRGRRNARPLTSRPLGSRSTPAAVGSRSLLTAAPDTTWIRFVEPDIIGCTAWARKTVLTPAILPP